MTPEQITHLRGWVEALRSGEYQQGMGVLRREDNYCCLGVACDLYRKEFGGEWKQGGDHFKFQWVIALLPATVQEWIGLSDNVQDELVRMNDSGKSFSEIADRIEELYLTPR